MQGTTSADMRFRRALGGVRVLVLALTGVLLAAALAAPASASASALDCSGDTLYSLQRPLTQSSSANGVVYGLQASTVGGSSVAVAQVTSLPGNTFPNALGITPDGGGLYAVDQSGSAGSATVWGYNALTGAWSKYAGSGGTPSGFVAGAVDPTNAIFYYAEYTAGTSSTPGKATLYGFDTTTNSAIPGVIATFDLPDGAGTAGQNGDFAFDQTGNLYVLASTGTTRAIGVVKGPLPTTGSQSGTQLSDTTLSSVSDSSKYNGIAFDASGKLYVESSSASGTWQISAVDPNNGAIVSGPTAIGPSEQSSSAADVDLASCAKIPTLTAQANVTARVHPSDQFTLSITGGTITQGNTATTSGNSTGVQSQSAGPVIATAGTSYTVSETASSGSISDYAVTYSCIDTAHGNAPVASGTGSSLQLTFPSTQSPSVVCSFATSPKADLAVTDSASPSSVPAGGRVTYTLDVTNNGPDGASGAQLSDALPGGVTVASVTSSQGSCTTTGRLSCALGSLASGASAQVVVTANVSRGAASGPASDAAAVSANESDPDRSNNTASATIQVTPAPAPISAPAPSLPATPAPPTPIASPRPAPVDLQVAIHADRQDVLLGQIVTYTVTVRNGGPGTAPTVRITNTAGRGLRVLSIRTAHGTCTYRASLSCELGALAPGQTVTITIRSVATTPGSQTLHASATVGCDTSGSCPKDANPNNNVSALSTRARAYVKLVQTVNHRVIKAGKLASIELKVDNPTLVRIQNLRVCERLPLGLAYIRSSLRTHLQDGRLCWSLGSLDRHGAKTIKLLVRGLSGPQRTLSAQAVASATGVRPVRAVRRVRVIPAPALGEPGVTG